MISTFFLLSEELEEEIDDKSTEEEEEDSESDEDALDGAMPTPKRRKVAQARALKASLDSGLYPMFWGIPALAQDLAPNENSAFAATGFRFTMVGRLMKRQGREHLRKA